LWVIDRVCNQDTQIIAVTLNEAEKQFSFKKSSIQSLVGFSNELQSSGYLYEPDAALLKSGAFNLIGLTYGLLKLHPQTQLYTSPEVNKAFPGRIFQITEILTTAALKKAGNLTGNVIVRNYPAKPEDLVKKYKIKPDKDQFLIFTKVANGDNVILKASIIQYY